MEGGEEYRPTDCDLWALKILFVDPLADEKDFLRRVGYIIMCELCLWLWVGRQIPIRLGLMV